MFDNKLSNTLIQSKFCKSVYPEKEEIKRSLFIRKKNSYF